jgi:hypothetical protein
MRHGRLIDIQHNGKTEQVYVFDDHLTRYVMKFDTNTNQVVISYHDPTKPLKDVRPIRKVIKKTYEGSAANLAFSKVLDNFELKMLEDVEEYNPKRLYVITNPKLRKDLTDVANNIKMPKDFRDFFFEVLGGNKVLRINTVVTQADIDRLGLNVDIMNKYLSALKDFPFVDKDAGWN